MSGERPDDMPAPAAPETPDDKSDDKPDDKPDGKPDGKPGSCPLPTNGCTCACAAAPGAACCACWAEASERLPAPPSPRRAGEAAVPEVPLGVLGWWSSASHLVRLKVRLSCSVQSVLVRYSIQSERRFHTKPSVCSGIGWLLELNGTSVHVYWK